MPHAAIKTQCSQKKKSAYQKAKGSCMHSPGVPFTEKTLGPHPPPCPPDLDGTVTLHPTSAPYREWMGHNLAWIFQQWNLVRAVFNKPVVQKKVQYTWRADQMGFFFSPWVASLWWRQWWVSWAVFMEAVSGDQWHCTKTQVSVTVVWRPSWEFNFNTDLKITLCKHSLKCLLSHPLFHVSSLSEWLYAFSMCSSFNKEVTLTMRRTCILKGRF